MMENQPPLTSPDESSNGNPLERCSCPLYSRDSTQEDHTISHKVINKSDCNNAVKEEIKEEGEADVMESSEGHQDPFKNVMIEPCSDTNPPERCPHPLYSQDSTQEDHTISHKGINASNCNNAVKEEIKEEDDEVGVMEFSEGHKDPFKDITKKPFSDTNPPERCPRFLDSTQEDHTIPHHHQGEVMKDIKAEIKVEETETLIKGDQQSMEEDGPVYSRESTQEDHTIPHHHQAEERINIKAEVKEEEVDTYVGGDQPSMKEVGMIMRSDQDGISPPINTNGCDARNTSEGPLILLLCYNNTEDNAITPDPPGVNPNTQNIHHRPSCPETSMDSSDQGESSHQSHTMIPNIHLGSHTADRSTDPSNPKESSLPQEGVHRGTDQRGRKQNILINEMKENSVSSLQKYPFTKRSDDEKKRVKELGPDRPNMQIQQQSSDRGRAYTRCFSTASYGKWSWLAGCEASHAFYCFPCLLFQSPGTETLWTATGVCDLKHLSEKCKRHESCRSHLDNTMRLQFFGKRSIAKQLDEGYRIGIRRHNEEVTKNRHILSRIIDCVKFCGAFELPLCGPDESEDYPGIFCGLVDFVASLDGVLKEHLQNASVFKGTSKTVQNELLDCMLSVVREHIIQEARSSNFLSIQADETTDIATQCQLVLVLRYIDAKSKVQERFFEFIPLHSATADSIATALRERLAVILPEDQKSKLISQAYDGASVMKGVHKQLKDVYPNAHYIHSYAHQLNRIIQQATSHIPKVRIFFSGLEGFDSFFSRSHRCTDVLDKVVAHRLPTSSSVRWNFHSRAINTVFEHREDLIRCFETIQDSGGFDPDTVREAGAFAMLLEDKDFKFFLHLFHNIMMHVDLLYSRLQKKGIDPVYIKGSIQQFHQDILKIRNSLQSLVDQCSEGGSQPKKRCSLNPDVHKRIAAKVFDAILLHTMERFSFIDHLVGATLLQAHRFEHYTVAFPEDVLSRTLKAYPVLNGSKLKTELSLIYCKEEFRTCRGAVDLLQLFMENNLEDVFAETVTLLKILITMPMATAEAERCFSTLKRIKTFLRNSRTQERLNALAMLSMEKRLVTEMTDFNQKVIEKFASQKERRENFLFK